MTDAAADAGAEHLLQRWDARGRAVLRAEGAAGLRRLLARVDADGEGAGGPPGGGGDRRAEREAALEAALADAVRADAALYDKLLLLQPVDLEEVAAATAAAGVQASAGRLEAFLKAAGVSYQVTSSRREGRRVPHAAFS